MKKTAWTLSALMLLPASTAFALGPVDIELEAAAFDEVITAGLHDPSEPRLRAHIDLHQPNPLAGRCSQIAFRLFALVTFIWASK